VAWHFARLTLRLIANGLRLGSAQVAGFVLAVLVAIVVATFGFWLLASVPHSHPDSARAVAVLSFSACLAILLRLQTRVWHRHTRRLVYRRSNDPVSQIAAPSLSPSCGLLTPR
jgi:uncharacterized membrane protein